jgi:hypothetical protein
MVSNTIHESAEFNEVQVDDFIGQIVNMGWCSYVRARGREGRKRNYGDFFSRFKVCDDLACDV